MDKQGLIPFDLPQEVLDGSAEIFISNTHATDDPSVLQMQTCILPKAEPAFLHITANTPTLYTPCENMFDMRFRGKANIEYQDGTHETVSIEVSADNQKDARKKFEIELYGAFLQAGYTTNIDILSFEEDNTPKIPVKYVADTLQALNSMPENAWETEGEKLQKELCDKLHTYNPNWWTDGYPELFEHCKNHTLEQLADEFVPGYKQDQKILAFAAFTVASLDLEWTYAYFPDFPLDIQHERVQTYDYYEEIEQDLDF